MQRIEHIETAGPDGRARRLLFSQGEPRLTSASVVRSLGLEVTQSYDEQELAALLGAAEAEHARERALRLLGYRERAVGELRCRLIDDGYPPPVADAVAARFAELGFVDDARFAGMFARSRAAAGYGRSRVARELAGHGVDAATVCRALDECFGDTDELERARAALRGSVAADRKERDRLVRRLVTRGFSFSTALRAVNPPDDDVSSDSL